MKPTLETLESRLTPAGAVQAGNDLFVTGTTGADNILVDSSRPAATNVTVNGVAYGPFALTGTSTVHVAALAGDDVIQAFGTLATQIDAGAGDDFVFTDAGNDFVDGGPGADFISAGAGNDTLIGGLGADYLDGGDGDDQLYAGTLFASDGQMNILTGDAGNDHFFVGPPDLVTDANAFGSDTVTPY